MKKSKSLEKERWGLFLLIAILVLPMIVATGIGIKEKIKINERNTIKQVKTINWEEISKIGFHNDYYNSLANFYNKNIEQGIYLPRINDEIVIIKVWESVFWYINGINKETNPFLYKFDNSFKKVTIVCFDEHCVRTEWINADLIKNAHSNWRLTQDVWKLDERLTNLEKGVKCGIKDNPFIPKRAKNARK